VSFPMWVWHSLQAGSISRRWAVGRGCKGQVAVGCSKVGRVVAGGRCEVWWWGGVGAGVGNTAKWQARRGRRASSSSRGAVYVSPGEHERYIGWSSGVAPIEMRRRSAWWCRVVVCVR